MIVINARNIVAAFGCLLGIMSRRRPRGLSGRRFSGGLVVGSGDWS